MERWIELGARSRLVVAHEIDGRGFRFDEGRAALVCLALAIVVLTSLQAYLRRRARAAAAGARAPRRSAAAEGIAPSRSFKSRDAVLDADDAAGSSRGDDGGVVRCPKCYGKYHAERVTRCPHCGADRSGAPAPSPAGTASNRLPNEARREAADPAPTRFHDAERLNDEGVEMLQKIHSVFRVDDAVKKFTLAIQRAPKNPTYHSNRGIAHLKNAQRRFAAVGDVMETGVQRDLERARADFQEAVRLKPRHANYHVLLGQLEELAGDWERARECHGEALALEPTNAAARSALDRLTRELEQADATHARERSERLMTEVARRSASGDLEGALAILNAALENEPGPAALLLAKADLLNRLNRVEESVEVARRAIEAQNREIQGLVASYQAKGLHALVLPTVGEGTELGLGTAASLPVGSPGRAAAVSGSLTELGLPDLLQVLGAGQKTVRVTLQRGSARGIVELETGRIVHAELDALNGEEAFYRIVAWTEGEFRIDPLIDVVSRTIEGSNDALILEGLRRLDESMFDAHTAAARSDG
ncbi:MAG: DUF4388 domain-containing protein [bacterium]